MNVAENAIIATRCLVPSREVEGCMEEAISGIVEGAKVGCASEDSDERIHLGSASGCCIQGTSTFATVAETLGAAPITSPISMVCSSIFFGAVRTSLGDWGKCKVAEDEGSKGVVR